MQPQQPRAVYWSQTQSSGTSSGTIVLMLVLVVVIVIGTAGAVFVFYAPFGALSRVSTGPRPNMISGVFLAVIDESNKSADYFGPAYRSMNTYESSCCLNGQVIRASFTLTLQGSVSRSVDSAAVAFSPGFILQSISPSLPRVVTMGSSETFTVTLQGPSSGFSGPITIDVFTH